MHHEEVEDFYRLGCERRRIAQWRWLAVFCIEEGGCDDGGEEECSESIRFFYFFFQIKAWPWLSVYSVR